MKFFGSLIKGDIGETSSIQAYFPSLDKGLQNPSALIAYGLKNQSKLARTFLKRMPGRIPEKTPEMRLVKDYVRTWGYPEVSKDEVDDLNFAEFAISGVP
ncbi:MAG: hypothetical protein ACXAB4_14325, partial [Candidatus Hodarchaeales archaeon]